MLRIALIAAVVAAGCNKSSPPEPAAKIEALPATAAPRPGAPVKAGELRALAAEEAAISYGVIVPAGGKPADIEAAARAAGANDVAMKPIAELQLDRQLLQILAGDALTPPDIDGILASAGIVFVQFTGKHPSVTLKKAAGATAELATAAKGWVMDSEAQRFLSAAAFAATVPGAIVDVRKQIVVKAVEDEGQLPFLLTAGMGKLGLPELYVRTLPRGRAGDVTTVINATAQTLARGDGVVRDGELDVDWKALGDGWDHDVIVKQGGTGKLTWRVAWVQEPDGEDMALERVPPGGATTEAIEAMLTTVFGDREGPVHDIAADDPEMLAAYAKARTELRGKRARFARGIPVRERLVVKAPFTYDDGGSDGTEWMWVDVVRFRGDVLEGTLANDPVRVTGIRAGSSVKVQLDSIGDYVHHAADGTEVGGYTIAIARKRGLLPPE